MKKINKNVWISMRWLSFFLEKKLNSGFTEFFNNVFLLL